MTISPFLQIPFPLDCSGRDTEGGVLGSRLLPGCEVWGRRRAREAATVQVPPWHRVQRARGADAGPQLVLHGTERSCAPRAVPGVRSNRASSTAEGLGGP